MLRHVLRNGSSVTPPRSRFALKPLPPHGDDAIDGGGRLHIEPACATELVVERLCKR